MIFKNNNGGESKTMKAKDSKNFLEALDEFEKKKELAKKVY